MDKEINYKADQIIKTFKPVAIKYNGDKNVGYNVLIKDKKSDFTVWLDVYIDTDYRDVRVEWNQYIFYTNCESDMIAQRVQADVNVYDEASSEAIEHLVSAGVIYQDQNGKWYNR